MNHLGPDLDRRQECESVLRSLLRWLGIEEALIMCARDTERCPTFAFEAGGQVVAFISLIEHVPASWEVHCMAVPERLRSTGHGIALLAIAERWLESQGVRFLQVKTVAQASPGAEYAETRAFHLARGFTPREVLPLLWAPQNPALQLVKTLDAADPTVKRSATGRPPRPRSAVACPALRDLDVLLLAPACPQR